MKWIILLRKNYLINDLEADKWYTDYSNFSMDTTTYIYIYIYSTSIYRFPSTHTWRSYIRNWSFHALKYPVGQRSRKLRQRADIVLRPPFKSAYGRVWGIRITFEWKLRSWSEWRMISMLFYPIIASARSSSTIQLSGSFCNELDARKCDLRFRNIAQCTVDNAKRQCSITKNPFVCFPRDLISIGRKIARFNGIIVSQKLTNSFRLNKCFEAF